VLPLIIFLINRAIKTATLIGRIIVSISHIFINVKHSTHASQEECDELRASGTRNQGLQKTEKEIDKGESMDLCP